jgi:hypothetical protein
MSTDRRDAPLTPEQEARREAALDLAALALLDARDEIAAAEIARARSRHIDSTHDLQ